MYTSGKVSIITPCYNSAGYIHRLLESILIQDYPDIELFAIDDGSTDKTREIIESFIPVFTEKGYTLTYIYQENAGQAAAINRGLKLVTGEFLTWPDSDDYYRCSNSISKLVSGFSQSNDSFGLVRCKCVFIEENSLHELGEGFKYINSEHLFLPFLTGEEFGGGAGVYMVKMSSFDNAVTNRDIYVGRQAQNCQLLEPLFYHYRCKTINEPLINILVRKNSHSHTVKPYDGQLDDIQGYIDIHTNTLKRMTNLPAKELENYIQIVNLRFLNDKLALALNFNKCSDVRKFAKEIKRCGGNISLRKRAKILMSYCPPMLRLLSWFMK